MKNFLFSFIIPCWNVEEYISEAVESVLAQSMGFQENIQIVLVNDGSTDGTGAICEDYQKRYADNIILLAKPLKSGVSAARNMGLGMATGRYINFLDADDKWDTDACRSALDFFKGYPHAHIACFPITLFGMDKGKHWLNEKFKETRLANIFEDPDCAVFNACSCFCERETVKSRFFDEQMQIAEDRLWFGKLLLDEQNFGLVAGPAYYYRKHPSQLSSSETTSRSLSYYLDTPRQCYLEILRYAQEKYGEVPLWAQYAVTGDLTSRLREKSNTDLSPLQKEEYRSLIQACLTQIGDQIILSAPNLWSSDRLYALALKYNVTYEQVKEWVQADAKKKALCFSRPGDSPMLFSRLWVFRVESLEISKRHLLLRGCCPVLIPRTLVRLVLIAHLPDGGVQEYPCELFRRADLKEQLFFEEELWVYEGFELSIPLADLADGTTIRAVEIINGETFALNWLHRGNSPFSQGEEQYRTPNGSTIIALADKQGIRVETINYEDSLRFQFSFVVPAWNEEKYLVGAVESVLNQTAGFEENIQLILVNDGSDDGTAAICRDYCERYPDNIVYIEQPHRGVSEARNAGLETSSGKYIGFLDADDRLDVDVCQKAQDFFDNHPWVHVACFPIMLFNENEEKHPFNEQFGATIEVAHIFKDPKLTVPGPCSCFFHWSVMQDRLFGEALPVSEDVVWMAQLFLDVQDFGLLPGPCYHKREQSDRHKGRETDNSRQFWYLKLPRLPHFEIFRYAREKYGSIPQWAQFAVLSDLAPRIQEEDNGVLSSAQKEKYQHLIRACFSEIDDEILLASPELDVADRICALAVKYGLTCKQVKMWIEADGRAAALNLRRPESQPLRFCDVPPLQVDFLDIVKDQLQVQGSFAIPVPRERMRLVLEAEFPNGDRRSYPCEVLGSPSSKTRLLAGEDPDVFGTFDLTVPLSDLAEGVMVRAIASIGDRAFTLDWSYEDESFFNQDNGKKRQTQTGAIIAKLPNNRGICIHQLLRFCDAPPLRVDFLDIAGGQLRLRGFFATPVPREYMKFVLEIEFPNGDRRSYPFELVGCPPPQTRLLVGEDPNAFGKFDVTVPLTELAEGVMVRAIASIGDRAFTLDWSYEDGFLFNQDDGEKHQTRTGAIIAKLPDNRGICIESFSGFLFSFIIPAYNVKPYLAEAVESVIAQTVGFENIQIILVNDGSTDGTGTVCKRYQELYPDNIISIDQPNGGMSSARNAGMQAATGRYINFLDGGDKWDPEACEAALDFFEKYPEINVACFPISLFGAREDAHWLNYKSKKTKVASILKDTEATVLDACACFARSNAVRERGFDETLPVSEETVWMINLLLDEQNFGLLPQPSYRRRSALHPAMNAQSGHLAYYLDVPRRCHLEALRHAREKYGEIPPWAQYAVMLDLTWRFKGKAHGNFLTSAQKEEYRALLRACLEQIDDQILLTVRNLWSEERLCALALKYNMTYEQVKAWVELDKKKGVLCFHQPGAQSLELADIPSLRLEFMDIADDRLLLRGSVLVLTPHEHMTFALETELPDGGKREYPCALCRRIDRKKRLFLENEIWAMESFEKSLPLVAGMEVRAFIVMDGRRFNLRWRHEKLSPFVRNKASYLSRAGYIIAQLPDDMGLSTEIWTDQRAHDLERAFFEQIARKPVSAIPKILIARIRQTAQKIRQLSTKPLWLISDRIAFAGDNGEALFEYLMATPEARKGIHPIFVLSRDSQDWERLKQTGPTVAYGSALHKMFFLAADKIISSSANANVINPFGEEDFPYRDLFNFDFIFLQHGVTKDDQTQWLNQADKNIALFVTAAQREYDSIVEGNYGYTADQVVLTGFPRHDELLRRAAIEKSQRLVAVMPTWRQNLVIARDPLTNLPLPNAAFEKSEYFQFWNGLLNHPRLLEALRAHNYRLRFATHPQSTHEGSKFKAPSPVEIVSHCDYTQTFCEAALLLTDYSSVAFDFALLRKPLVYAHFDYETFYSGHTYSRGYFDYKLDGFGPVCPNLETTVDAIIRFLENGCVMEPMYRDRAEAFFGVQPENRCQAVVDAIKKLGRRLK